MKTIKSFSDLSQSRKLIEILPIETADLYWLNRHIDLTETKYEVFVIDKSNKYIDFFKSYAVAIDNKEIIPCWSLAALFSVIPEGIIENYYAPNIQKENGKYSIAYGNEELLCKADNPLDACYEMILKLHEHKLL